MNNKITLENLNKKNYFLKLLIGTHLISWVFNLPLLQLQMNLFGKKIISLLHFTIIELVIILIIILMSCRIYLNKISKYTIFLTMILIIIGLSSIIINNVEIYWIIYYISYWIFPFIIIILSNQVIIDTKKLSKSILIIITIHCILIFMQKYNNDIIWPFTIDESGNQIFYVSEGYYNTTDKMLRCPGMSISGLDAGILLVFGYVLLDFIESRKSKIKIFFKTIFIIGIWFTGTRNIYILLIYIIFYKFLINISPNKLRGILANIYMIFCSIFYTVMFFIIGLNYSNSTQNILTDTLSAEIRINNWTNIIDMIKGGTILQKILGQFKWQSSMINTVIDNVFIEVILFCGFLGLICFFLYIIIIHARLIKYGDKNTIPIIGFMSGIMIYGVANSLGNIYLSLIVICIVILNNYKNFRSS